MDKANWKKVLVVRVPPDLHAFISEQAKRELMTVSTWACRTLAERMTALKASESRRYPKAKGNGKR